MAQEHYFSVDPSANRRISKVEFEVCGQQFSLSASSGTFSSTALDTGTRVLLKHCELFPDSGNVLDLGCGWGPISVSIAKIQPETTLWALDVNQRSLEQTKINAKALGLSNVNPVLAEQLPKDIKFSAIWSNPPIRVGKKVLHDLMRTYLPKLVPGGKAYLVVQKHLGAESFQKWLSEEFPAMSVTRLSTDKTYRVIEVTN